MNLVDVIEKENLRKDVPAFEVGDTVKVYVKVVEGDKERLQAYEGVVIAKRNGSIRESFTVRRISYGIGVERTFPLHSPRISKVEVVRKGKVRRAKLYYLADRQGKAAKVQEKRKTAKTDAE
jgi:large subunit ribosomal protein L19